MATADETTLEKDFSLAEQSLNDQDITFLMENIHRYFR